MFLKNQSDFRITTRKKTIANIIDLKCKLWEYLASTCVHVHEIDIKCQALSYESSYIVMASKFCFYDNDKYESPRTYSTT